MAAGLLTTAILPSGCEVSKLKDIFNGNIKKEYIREAKASLILFSVLMFICGVFFLWGALFYEKVEEGARILLFILAGISLLLTIVNPAATIYFVKRQDQYPRIARLLLKEYLFKDNKSKYKK